jgi:hypothetical protein
MKVYLAGPLGFSEAGRCYYDGTLVPEIARLGHEILDRGSCGRAQDRRGCGNALWLPNRTPGAGQR